MCFYLKKTVVTENTCYTREDNLTWIIEKEKKFE